MEEADGATQTVVVPLTVAIGGARTVVVLLIVTTAGFEVLEVGCGTVFGGVYRMVVIEV